MYSAPAAMRHFRYETAPGNTPQQASWLNFDDKLPESLAVIGLLAAVGATNIIFFRCHRGSGGRVECEDQGASLTPGAAEGQCCPANGQPAARVDTVALTGLRGLAALHVAAGHYSGQFGGPDLLGGASMSFFYLLSGFVMTLGYARPAKAADLGFDTRRFLRNRFARLYPSYLLTTLTAFGLMVWTYHITGYLQQQLGPLLFNFGLSVLGVNMWVIPLSAWIADPTFVPSLPVNPVSWTVQTMSLFYLFFPVLLPWLRRVTHHRAAITALYWLQLLVFLSLFGAGVFLIGQDSWGYWVARGWPLSRFSVFAMGCVMAFERSRGDGVGRSLCMGLWCGAGGRPAEERVWGRRATCACTWYLVILAGWVTFVELVAPQGFATTSATQQLAFELIRGAVEALVPLLFVDLIGALTRCGDAGLAAKLCRSPAMQRMGDISMTFYMVHILVLQAASVACRAPPPAWTAPILFFCSLVVGWLLAHGFEAPVRRLLRG